MNLVSALGLALALCLFLRQLRRDPAQVPKGRRVLLDALYVIYSLALAAFSASGYVESIDAVEKAIYGTGIAAGILLVIALLLVRLTPLGRRVIKA